VLRTVCAERTLWEAILPPGAQDLNPELARVDALFDDPSFFSPFVPHFSLIAGRLSIPMETYLRMMFLRFRHGLSYEAVCAEVGDSISWQRFCRIPLGTRVPHPTTLSKISRRCGPGVVEELNETLLAKAADAKVLRAHKLRADTTVVEANVAYPSDSGLLAKAVATIAALIAKIHAAGGATRTRARDRTRSARRRAREISAHLRLRNDEAKAAVRRVNFQLAVLAEAAANDAQAVLRNARRMIARQGNDASGRLRRAAADLDVLLGRTATVVAQTRLRLSGTTPDGATRLVSLHDPDARPIVKGRLGKPVEFGFKAQVVDNPDGVVLDHRVEIGNPADAHQLAPAIARAARRLRRVPRSVTADRGYGEAGVDAALAALGVNTIVIPRKGKPSKERRELERSRSFRRLVKWRTGAEGRISHLKHGYRWNRTLTDGIDGARTWCGWGVLAHTSIKVSGLIETKADRNTRRQVARRQSATPPEQPPGPPPTPGVAA